MGGGSDFTPSAIFSPLEWRKKGGAGDSLRPVKALNEYRRPSEDVALCLTGTCCTRMVYGSRAVCVNTMHLKQYKKYT